MPCRAAIPLVRVLVISVAVWGASSIGFFWLQPLFDAPDGYNDAPIAYAVYYAVWVLVAFIALRPGRFGWLTAEVARAQFLPIAGMVVLLTVVVLVVLPSIPGLRDPTLSGPTEIHFVNPGYFLPKSVEVLLQQVFITAIVLELGALHLSISAMSVLISIAFGGVHLSLLFVYAEPSYAYRFTIAAMLFGAVAPILLMKVPRGFYVSYGLHWGFYAWLALLNTSV